MDGIRNAESISSLKTSLHGLLQDHPKQAAVQLGDFLPAYLISKIQDTVQTNDLVTAM